MVRRQVRRRRVRHDERRRAREKNKQKKKAPPHTYAREDELRRTITDAVQRVSSDLASVRSEAALAAAFKLILQRMGFRGKERTLVPASIQAAELSGVVLELQRQHELHKQNVVLGRLGTSVIHTGEGRGTPLLDAGSLKRLSKRFLFLANEYAHLFSQPQHAWEQQLCAEAQEAAQSVFVRLQRIPDNHLVPADEELIARFAHINMVFLDSFLGKRKNAFSRTIEQIIPTVQKIAGPQRLLP